MLIALDIGNVCLRIHPELTAAAFGFDPNIQRTPAVSELIYRYNAGLVTTEEWISAMSNLTGCPETEVIRAWNIMIGEPFPEMNEAVRKLTARGVEFVFLSDISVLHLTEVRRKLPFMHLVKNGVFSCEAGACKPEAKMYEIFERRFGKPDLYLDDLEKNIQAASLRGWNAVQFPFDPAAGAKILMDFAS